MIFRHCNRDRQFLPPGRPAALRNHGQFVLKYADTGNAGGAGGDDFGNAIGTYAAEP